MLVSKLIEEVNSLADDQIEDDRVLAWVNDAFAAVGSEAQATFPDVVLTDELNDYLPRKWQRLLIKVYATARLKEQDSSQFEYQDLYSQFLAHLTDYTSIKDVVPVQFRDLLTGSEILVNGVMMYSESGDTLYQIAEDNAVPVDSLVAENTDDNGKLTLKFGTGPAEPDFEDNWYRWDN